MTQPTDHEKSVTLARLTGVGAYSGPAVKSSIVDSRGIEHDVTTIDGTPHDYQVPNLYDSANMELAWMVLNWAAKQFQYGDSYEAGYTIDDWAADIVLVEEEWGAFNLWDLPPAEAQRAWLDKILELATEAGMVSQSPHG